MIPKLPLLLLFIVSFASITWVLFRALRRSYFPPHNDDDGGTPVDVIFPTFDPPSGNGLDDLLVDRPPKDWNKTPSKPMPQGTRGS
jgi:hypothetical protein